MKRLLKTMICLIISLTVSSTGVFVYADSPIISPEARAETILNVVLPTNLPFIIDPLELAERGGIYSDKFEIQNHSNVDVMVTISSIRYMFADNTSFIVLEAPYTDGQVLDEKAIYMALRSDDGDIAFTELGTSGVKDFLLSASNYNEDGQWVSFNEGSCMSFEFIGNVNNIEEKLWDKDDVKISVTYHYRPVRDIFSDEEEITEDSEEDTDTIEESDLEELNELCIEESGLEELAPDLDELDLEDLGLDELALDLEELNLVELGLDEPDLFLKGLNFESSITEKSETGLNSSGSFHGNVKDKDPESPGLNESGDENGAESIDEVITPDKDIIEDPIITDSEPVTEENPSMACNAEPENGTGGESIDTADEGLPGIVPGVEDELISPEGDCTDE